MMKNIFVFRIILKSLFTRQGLTIVTLTLAILTLIHASTLLIPSKSYSIFEISEEYREPRDLVRQLSAGVEKVIEAEWMNKENNLENDDSIESLFDKRKRKILAKIFGNYNPIKFPKVSAIITIRDFPSTQRVIDCFYRTLKHLPTYFVDDVIVVISRDTSIKPEVRLNQQLITEEIRKHDNCNVIFLNNYYYENVNRILRFVINDLIVSIDGRVQLTDFWLEPMVAKMIVNKNRNLFISPHIRLSNEDGSEMSQGDYRTQITWDFGVVRSSDDKLLREIEENNLLFIQQSALSKEVFLFSKESYQQIFGFHLIPEGFGAEDAAMSLKIISCKMDILQSRFSIVLFPLPVGDLLTESRLRTQADIISPTFFSPEENVTEYTWQMTQFWFDEDSRYLHDCSKKGKTNPDPDYYVFHHMSKKTWSVKKLLDRVGCRMLNFTNTFSHLQSRMFKPKPRSIFYGFIRNLNGMYAFGFLDVRDVYKRLLNGDKSIDRVSQNLLLSRNSSHWIGSFSYTNHTIVLNETLCVTETTEGYLGLAKCDWRNRRQQFLFEDNLLRLARDTTKCVGIHTDSNVYSYLRVVACSEKFLISKFKFDIEFEKGCLQPPPELDSQYEMLKGFL